MKIRMQYYQTEFRARRLHSKSISKFTVKLAKILCHRNSKFQMYEIF